MLRVYFIFFWSAFIALLAAAIGWAFINVALALWPINTQSLEVSKVIGTLGFVVFCIQALALQLLTVRIRSRIKTVREILKSKPSPVLGIALLAMAWVIRNRLRKKGSN